MNLSRVTLKNGTKNALLKCEAHTEITMLHKQEHWMNAVKKYFCFNATKVPSTILGVTILEMNEQSQNVPGFVKFH